MVYVQEYRFFFFNDTATTEIYTLSLHDALPICRSVRSSGWTTASRASCTSPSWPSGTSSCPSRSSRWAPTSWSRSRSEEHTSELQSRQYLVCRLLLEKKKNKRL